MAVETLGFVDVVLTASNREFLRGTRQAANEVQRFEQNVTSQFRNITRTFNAFNTLVGGAVIASIGALTRQWAIGADAAGTFASRLDVSVEQLSRLQFVAEKANVPIDTFNDSLQEQTLQLNDAVAGNKELQGILTALGLDFVELNNLKADEAFLKIADRLGRLENAGDKATVATKLWSEEGAALIQIANLGADEIERLMMRSDELGNTLTNEGVKGARDFNSAMTDFTAVLGSLANTVLPALLKPITFVLEVINDLAVGTKKAAKSIIESFKSLGGLATGPVQTLIKGLRGIFPNLALLLDFFSALRSTSTNNSPATVLDQLGDSAERASGKIGPLIVRIDGVGSIIDDTNTSLENYRKKLKDQEDQVIRNQEELEALWKWYLSLDDALQLENQDFFIKEQERMGQVFSDSMEKSERAIVDWERVGEQALGDFVNAFQTFGEDLIAKNESIFDSLKRTAIRILQDIITAYATQKIAVAIAGIGGRGGDTGQTGGSAGEASAGIGGAIFSGIASTFLGPLAGAAASILIGGALNSLLGGGSRIKETQLFLGNIEEAINAPAFGNVENPFGTFGFGLHRFGNEGQLSNAEADRVLKALTEAGLVMAEIDETLAETLTDLQFNAVQEALRALPQGSVNYDPENIDQFIRERYGAIFGAIDDSLAEVFTSLSGELEGDAILQFANDVVELQKVFAEGGQIFDDVADASETVNILMTEFAKRGETLAGVLERMGLATAILEQLGLEGGTTAGGRFNLSVLEEFNNDAARLESLVSTFFGTFFSDLENLERAAKDLSGIVGEVLAGLGTTRDTFARDFLSGIEEGTLEPEDIREFLEAGEAIAKLIELEEELAQIRETDARDAVAGQITAINAQIDAQTKLLSVIDSVSSTINREFSAAIENIQLALLDQRGQYEFFQKRIEELTATLGMITDPEELAATLLEIEERVSRAFNLLTPEEQQAIGPQFVEFLNEQLAAGQERLTELENAALAERQALEARRENIERELSEGLLESSGTNLDAAELFLAAVGQFAEVVSQPQRVTVALDLDLVGP